MGALLAQLGPFFNGAVCLALLNSLEQCSTPPQPSSAPSNLSVNTLSPTQRVRKTVQPSAQQRVPTPVPVPTRPSIQPTVDRFRPTNEPTLSPTKAPTPMPTTECHLLDTPPQLALTPGNAVTLPAVNRLIPVGCVLGACTTAVTGSVLAVFQLVGATAVSIRVTSGDGSQGLNVGIVVAESIIATSAFCAVEVNNPATADAATVEYAPFTDSTFLQYLVITSSMASGPIADGANFVITPAANGVGGVGSGAMCGFTPQILDVGAPIGTFTTYSLSSFPIPGPPCTITASCSFLPSSNALLILEVTGSTSVLGPSITATVSSGSMMLGVGSFVSLTGSSCLRFPPEIDLSAFGADLRPDERFLIFFATTTEEAFPAGATITITVFAN